MANFSVIVSTLLALFYQLLHCGTPWHWGGKECKPFQASNDLLTSSELLIHFNPDLPLLLACDDSAYGVRAVLAH